MSDDEEEYVYSSDEGEENVLSGGGGGGGGSSSSSSSSSSSAVKARPPPAVRAPSPSRQGAFGGQDYRLLREDEIRGELNALVSSTAATLAIPPECACLLLAHFRWSRERATDAYYTDTAGTMRAAGITHLGRTVRSTAAFACEICLEPKGSGEGFGLGCGHIFCTACWRDNLAVAVQDAGTCIGAKCPAPKCSEAITAGAVGALASPAVSARWALYEQKHFVSVAKNMAWCPAQGCSNAFVARTAVRLVKCNCGLSFCFRCSKEAHAPVACDRLEAWLEKCGNESETANWILVNTKKCPQCQARIEKNQGCNHIKCSNKGCRHEFCWICLAPWSEHGQTSGGFYKCNKFTSKAQEGGSAAGGGGGAAGEAARAKADLEKYLFYFQRYMNHEQAGRFAVRHRAATQKRMADLALASGEGSTWAEVSFLESATEALLECRRVLKYTYAAGYYMPDGAEKSLFEHLQEQLERSTEQLQELTEAPLEKISRQDVVNFTRATMQFLKNLLEGMDEGLTTQEVKKR